MTAAMDQQQPTVAIVNVSEAALVQRRLTVGYVEWMDITLRILGWRIRKNMLNFSFCHFFIQYMAIELELVEFYFKNL